MGLYMQCLYLQGVMSEGKKYNKIIKVHWCVYKAECVWKYGGDFFCHASFAIVVCYFVILLRSVGCKW